MYKNGGLIAKADFVGKLERKFTSITKALYTTSVPYDVLEKDVMPYIADDFIFKNPWQDGGDKNMYSIGMKGK
jgi:hypothetical protein